MLKSFSSLTYSNETKTTGIACYTKCKPAFVLAMRNAFSTSLEAELHAIFIAIQLSETDVIYSDCLDAVNAINFVTQITRNTKYAKLIRIIKEVAGTKRIKFLERRHMRHVDKLANDARKQAES